MGQLPTTKLGFLFLLASLISGIPSSFGGTEKFYENSSGSPLLSLIQTATQSIDIEIYQMNDPQIQDALKAAITKGVKIRIVQEGKPVATSCDIFAGPAFADNAACTAQKNLISFIRSKGGTYVPFAYHELCGVQGTHCYQHGKMVVIDSRYALLSTGNFNTSSLCTHSEHPTLCNRDYTMVSSDATLIRTLQSIFEKDLAGKAYDVSKVIASSGTDKLTVSPNSMQPLVQLIQSAKKTLQIQNQYLKDPTLNAAIVAAAKRGVQVFVMVKSACAYAKPSENEAAQWKVIYGAFDKAKVNTRIFTSKMAINGVTGSLHAKAILVDSVRAWVGSVNGSTTSLSNNREYGMFFNDAAEVQKLATYLYSDYTNANSESWKDSLICKNDRSTGTPDDGGDGFAPVSAK